MCLYVEDEERTLIDSGTSKARVEHRCQECERTIEPGETYHWWKLVDWDHDFITEKMCAHCRNTITLGCDFTGCHPSWFWGMVHDLIPAHRDNEGSFVTDILREHDLTTGQKRAMVRCVRGYRRRWRDRDGALLPLVEAPPNASPDQLAQVTPAGRTED